MREIKFRAWIPNEKRMVIVDKLDMYGKGRGNCWSFDIGFHHNSEKNKLYRDDTYKIKLMQYTGLKDKNGKEIYEGDIYNYDNEIGVFRNIKELYFEELMRYRMEDGEIIGNIYENKNLLNEIQ